MSHLYDTLFDHNIHPHTEDTDDIALEIKCKKDSSVCYFLHVDLTFCISLLEVLWTEMTEMTRVKSGKLYLKFPWNGPETLQSSAMNAFSFPAPLRHVMSKKMFHQTKLVTATVQDDSSILSIFLFVFF